VRWGIHTRARPSRAGPRRSQRASGAWADLVDEAEVEREQSVAADGQSEAGDSVSTGAHDGDVGLLDDDDDAGTGAPPSRTDTPQKGAHMPRGTRPGDDRMDDGDGDVDVEENDENENDDGDGDDGGGRGGDAEDDDPLLAGAAVLDAADWQTLGDAEMEAGVADDVPVPGADAAATLGAPVVPATADRWQPRFAPADALVDAGPAAASIQAGTAPPPPPLIVPLPPPEAMDDDPAPSEGARVPALRAPIWPR
jgi:hypothetical protein